MKSDVKITIDNAQLSGSLGLPPHPIGLVLFVHGSGSSRQSPRNIAVSDQLQAANIATLLFDLLTAEEEKIDRETQSFRFNTKLLTQRLSQVTGWVGSHHELHGMPIGYFGASTGSAAALIAAAELKHHIHAIVSRGGRPDLAKKKLSKVTAPTLLIVGGNDDAVIELNKRAYDLLTCKKEMKVVAGATHLFEEPGTLQSAAALAAEWFKQHLPVEHAAEPLRALP